MVRYRQRIFTSCLLLGVLLILGGCGSVNYDDQADQQLTSITQESNQQFTTWESQAAAGTPVTYDKTFYDKIEADIKTLEIRMEASQDVATQNLIPVFSSLLDQLEQLRTLHIKQKKFSDTAFLTAESNLLNVQFAALVTYELSLKPNTVGSSPTAKTQSTATSTAGAKASAAPAK
jgi:uncharacterized protein YceK